MESDITGYKGKWENEAIKNEEKKDTGKMRE